MGSVSSFSVSNIRGEIAKRVKPFKSRATYATVNSSALDQQVEMTNWEKVRDVQKFFLKKVLS